MTTTRLFWKWRGALPSVSQVTNNSPNDHLFRIVWHRHLQLATGFPSEFQRDFHFPVFLHWGWTSGTNKVLPQQQAGKWTGWLMGTAASCTTGCASSFSSFFATSPNDAKFRKKRRTQAQAKAEGNYSAPSVQNFCLHDVVSRQAKYTLLYYE